MPRVSPKKIKSALDDTSTVLRVVFVLAVACISLVLYVLVNVRDVTKNTYAILFTPAKNYHLALADTPELHAQGLGGRQSLAAGEGMLFSYPAQDERCFWMKDMRFPIDIIWVDGAKKITRIEADLQPETYPRQYCAPAQYVIELNSGEAGKNSFKAGSTLHFDDFNN